jgi:predicted metal-binding membrane protein
MGSILTLLVVMVVLFLIGVVVLRWVLRINEIVALLKNIAERSEK